MGVISGTYYKIDKNSANFSGVFVYLFKIEKRPSILKSFIVLLYVRKKRSDFAPLHDIEK